MLPYSMSLFTEAVVVGFVLAAVLGIQWTIRQPRTIQEVVATGFVMGACIHLAFEAAGANSWYCRHGAACRL